ncbi:putative PurR-regulated permease PerM [Nakamurella sp. UYEF19]|uniref:AI-2E family transporter n=1 Tax=Nakamurella sp. UYEF19 TaxID=1756392 RepID=UPI0033913A7A
MPSRGEQRDQRRPSAGTDRGEQIGGGLRWISRWALRLVVVAAGTWVVGYVLGRFWSILLPIVLALFVASVLWPTTAWLRNHRWPPALAASVVLLAALLVVGAAIALIIPSVIDQAPEIATRATDGLDQVQKWLSGPPVNLNADQISGAVDSLATQLQSSASSIAAGVFAGVTSAIGLLITVATALILVFFFLKDGPRFLPWLVKSVGERAGRPLSEVLMRCWAVVGSFIRTQALVSLIDAVLIGGGLLGLGVPLALPLAVLTFFGGFIPIVGAFVAGAIAVLVALVTKSLTTALIVLMIIIVVQQLEGNVLQPLLQSRTMNLHAAVVLLAVTIGSTLYGITGAFLAVPVVAVVSEIWRYLAARMDGRESDDEQPDAASNQTSSDAAGSSA